MVAQMEIRQSIGIRRPVIEVFEYMCEPEHVPDWAPYVSRTSLLSPAAPNVTQHKNGFGKGAIIESLVALPMLPIRARFVVTDLQWGRALAFRAIASGEGQAMQDLAAWASSFWFAQTAVYTFEPTVTGTLITAHHDPRSFGFGTTDFARPIVAEYLSQVLSNLKRNLELTAPKVRTPFIFFNYRRVGSEYVSGRIRERLDREFGAGATFLDSSSIKVADDWKGAIEKAIASCRAMLVLITPAWLDGLKQRRARSKAEPDWVRREIATAYGLKQRPTIVPLLVNDAQMPAADELPADVRELSGAQALELRIDPDFEGDMDALVGALWEHVVPGNTVTSAGAAQGDVEVEPAVRPAPRPRARSGRSPRRKKPTAA